MSHLCDSTVAGPAVRRDNVLASKCECPPFRYPPFKCDPDVLCSSIGEKLKGSLLKGSFDKACALTRRFLCRSQPPPSPPLPFSLTFHWRTTLHHPPEPDPKPLPRDTNRNSHPLRKLPLSSARMKKQKSENHFSGYARHYMILTNFRKRLLAANRQG